MSTRQAGMSRADATAREAVQVVRTVMPGFEPVLCEPLKQTVKSAVFAVHGREGHPTVVAKCASTDTISLEHRVLSWLEAAPFPTVIGHGTRQARGPGRGWLVSQHAGGQSYDPRSPTHRSLAGAWLADLHAWSASVPRPQLPARGAEYHRNAVDAACATLTDTLSGAAGLTADDAATIIALRTLGWDVLERWDEIEAALQGLPVTLVHSDVGRNNVQVVHEVDGSAVLAFDWEQAGWGCPAADISMVDLDSYTKRARPEGIELPDGHLVAAVGTLLWCFAAVPGERSTLLGAWNRRPLGKLAFYLGRVRAAMSLLAERRP
jgi:Ser/Thr protein kinase RdoA (MazF antagonist)